MLWRHALPNALVPVLTILGMQFSFLLAGGVIIENVFFLPGLGRLVFQAIVQRDLIVVQSVVVVLVFAVVMVTFLVDLAYVLVNPQLRAREAHEAGRAQLEPRRRRRSSPALFVAIALRSRSSGRRTTRGLCHIVDKLQPPDAHHWFGTDQLGRDVLSMIMAGAQTSVGVALLSVVIGVCVGVPLGLLGAARRGAVDEIVMRGNDLIFAFPALLLAILITAVFGPGAVNAIIAIGIFNIPVFARVTRAGALQLWTRDYTLAARVAGKGRCGYPGSTCCRTCSGCCSCKEPSSFRWASSRRRASRTWAWARSRRRPAGGACSTRRKR